jgi:hypothetical protein
VILDQHTVTAVTSTGVTLKVKSGSVTLDEAWSPYGQLAFTCALPSPADRDLLDIRDAPIRVDVRLRQDFGRPWSLAAVTAAHGGSLASLTEAFGGTPLGSITVAYFVAWNSFSIRAATTREFNLLITERSFDYQRGEMDVTAATDEARLQGDALVATSIYTPTTTSVRSLVQLVLARIGATLQSGTNDAAVDIAATAWEPGRSGWEYIAPLLETANLRLWCDEDRRWYLTTPQPISAGALALSPETGTVTRLSDRMTRHGLDWFDAVVILYKWTDEFDLAQTAYDVAGATSPTNVFVETRARPYPGSGAAAGILSRAQGRGRQLEISAVSNYQAQPGQPATVTIPGTDLQTGFVSSVSWDVETAEMAINARGLTDTPVTSWLFAPVGTSWNDIPAGTSWLEYEGV